MRTAAWTTNGSIFNLDFEKDDERSLLVVVFPKNCATLEAALGGDIEKALTGKAIEAKGQLAPYGGRVAVWKNPPQIILSSPDQLNILAATPKPVVPTK